MTAATAQDPSPAPAPTPAAGDGGGSSMASTPLHHRWTLWYDNPRLAPAGTDWHDNLKNLGTFSSAEQFWQIFNNVQCSSALPVNSNYHLFKEGIEPMWEDPANQEGGKFVLTIPKKDARNGRGDEWWLFTVLAVVGEAMDVGGNEVCGCVVSIRKAQDRIALWLKSSDRKICTEIGARWKRALEVSNKTSLKFQAHKDATASGSSFKNEIKFEV